MKYFILVISVFFGLATALPGLRPTTTSAPDPECTGWCPPKCKEDEYVYNSNCDYFLPQATCSNPNPVRDMQGQLCDYMACYCKPPKVRSEDGKCILPKQCPRPCKD